MGNLLFDHHPDDLPDTYVMTGDGRCLEPDIMDGTKLLFSRTERYQPGDFVAIFKRREFTIAGDHQVVIKRLIIAPRAEYWERPAKPAKGNVAPTVVVEMLNPRKILHFDPAGLLGLHKCLGPVPAGLRTFKVNDDWIRGKANERRRSTA